MSKKSFKNSPAAKFDKSSKDLSDGEYAENCLLWHLMVWDSALRVLEGTTNAPFTFNEAVFMNDFYCASVLPMLERTEILINRGVIPSKR